MSGDKRTYHVNPNLESGEGEEAPQESPAPAVPLTTVNPIAQPIEHYAVNQGPLWLAPEDSDPEEVYVNPGPFDGLSPEDLNPEEE